MALTIGPFEAYIHQAVAQVPQRGEVEDLMRERDELAKQLENVHTYTTSVESALARLHQGTKDDGGDALVLAQLGQMGAIELRVLVQEQQVL